MILKIEFRTVRAVCFLSHGQKVEEWLPKADYRHGGECWLDTVNNVRAVTLHRLDVPQTWYVRTDIVGQPGVEVLPA